MEPSYLQAKHAAALLYHDYVKTGTADQQTNWQRIYAQTHPTPAQQTLLQSFTRRMPVLVISGLWCGDCAQQVPLLTRLAEANPQAIDLRILDRDQHPDLQKQVRVNGGDRVPVAIFCAEDYEMVGWFGDRTLHRYRAIAARQLGPSCPLPGAPVAPDELAATLQDWLDQLERAHLVLRLSPRLRRLYAD